MGTNRKTVGIFWRESMRYPWRAIGTLVFWPIGNALQDMGLPFVAALTINKLVQMAGSGQPFEWQTFVPYLVSFAVLGVLGQSVVYYTFIHHTIWIQTRVRENLHNKVYRLLLDHSMHFHANSFSGALVSQASRFANAYVAITDIVITQGLNTLTKLVASVTILFFFSPMIAGALLAWTIFFAWVNIAMTKKRIILTRQAAAAETVLTAHLADTMGNIGAVKAFAREEDESAAYAVKAHDRKVKTAISWTRAVRNGTVTALMMISLQVIVLSLSIYAVGAHHVPIGTILLAQVYVTQLTASLWNLSSLTRGLEQNFSDAAEMTEIMSQPLDVRDPKDPKPFTVPKGDIHLNHFDFAHSDAKDNEPLFKDFDLHIGAGEKVGLVGHSGSGKTTLVRLLLRFADINKGAILIDGQDIASVRQADLRAHIAYVPQEPLLFHRSIHENITYGRPGASREEVIEAAKQANAHEFIVTLPDGYDTMVGERGVKLSGGQRQRIVIARAILKNAPILILDEATSALDSESEKLIQDALNKLMKGRTTIVIAHRLSTIQKMDRIVVLDDGRITEQGSHAELLAAHGTYAELWAHQSGGFIKE